MFRATIPIIFATNNGYAPYVSVAISSLIRNSSENYFYKIHVLHTELDEKNRAMLEGMSGENYSVGCLCVDRFIESETKYMYTNFHFSKEMFYRILIPSIFPEYERAIYLDSDIVVLDDIMKLFSTELDGNLIGGCCDIMHGKSRAYVAGELGMDPERYINSGVLLIDCNAWRQEKVKEKCFDILSKRRSLRYPDQDIINLSCAGRIKFLPQRWNYIWHYHFRRTDPSLNLPESMMKSYLDAADDIAILHYTSAIKPWKNKNVSLADHFWKYAEGTPYESKILSDFISITNRNYITYHFMIRVGQKIRFTASFQTLEGLTLSDVILNVKGAVTDFEEKNVLMTEIAGKTYIRYFFTFSVDVSDLAEKIRIVIYNRGTGIPLSITSAKTFDVSFNTQSTVYSDGMMIYKDRSALIIEAENEKGRLERERVHKANLSRRSGNSTYKKSLVLRFIYRLLRPFFRKEVWIISDRASEARDNGEAFFKYLARTKPKGILPVFVIDKASPDYKRLKKYGRVISPYSKAYQIYYLFATRNISSHLEKPITEPIHCHEFLKDILSKNKVVFLQHGITKDDVSFAYNRPKDNTSLFITAAKDEYLSIINTPAYHCDESIVRLTGFARFDELEDRAERIIFILPTWRRSAIADLYRRMPVSDFRNTSYYKFYSALLSDKRLISTARKNGYRICFYQHYMMEHTDSEFDTTDPIFIPREEFSYNDVFCRGALLLTDYSSTQFDFAYLKKPVVYTHFDKEEFFGSHTYTKGYFSYESSGFGEIANDLDETVSLLIPYIENGCRMKPEYIERVNKFFRFTDRNNCERIFDEIKNI